MKNLKFHQRSFINLFLFLIITLCTHGMSGQTTNGPIHKSTVLFTQESAATTFNYDKYKADGVFWGFMPNASIASDAAMNQWVSKVKTHTSDSKYFFGRGEFDWGWKWMIDFMNDPELYWAKNLNGDAIEWGNAADSGGVYNGYTHSWMSHQGPEFLAWLKYQVDRMTLAPVTHMMFDSQTSSTRTLHWLGGDFSIPSMNGFREYMRKKYTPQELISLGINNINNFNYRQFLINKGFTLQSYRAQANSINGNIPLYKDFVYFQRQSLNDTMEELFEYIDTKRPGIQIGATTNVVEPRGYIFSDRLTYLAGEYGHPHEAATSPSTEPLLHYKAAEALDKTLIYFPYPDAFKALHDRSSPRQARAWIAQAYATGSIFTIPGNVWVGGSNTWDTGWENFADVYEFIHDHSELFDNYKAVSNVALAYSVYASLLEGGMSGSSRARQTIDYLVKRNISFDLKIFGDPDQPIAPTVSELGQYDVILHDSDIQYLTSAQNSTLRSNSSKVISMGNANEILNKTSWKINVLQNNQWANSLISTFPRMSSNDPEAPYVIHLINRKYNPSNDSAQTHNNISVEIPAKAFPNTIVEATLHIPGRQSVDLSLQTNSSGTITLDLGKFDTCWGILELKHNTTSDTIAAIPGTFQAEQFNSKSGSVKIENTPGSGGKNLGFIRNNDFTEYKVNVASAGRYTFDIYASSAGTGGSVQVLKSGSVLGTVAIPNNGNWHAYKKYTMSVDLNPGIQTLRFLYKGDTGYLFNVDRVEASKNVEVTKTITLAPIHDAFLQGATRYNGTILRLEQNNRIGYLMFDLSSVNGNVTAAQLNFTVTADNGNGNVRVNKGNSNDWTENNISNTNKPAAGVWLGNLDSNYTIHSEKTINLNPTEIGGGKISLILAMTNGNDFAFASKENPSIKGPELKITYTTSEVVSNVFALESVQEASAKNTTLSLHPNPAKNSVVIEGLERSTTISIYNQRGVRVRSFKNVEDSNEINVSDLPTGFYYLRSDSETLRFYKQ